MPLLGRIPGIPHQSTAALTARLVDRWCTESLAAGWKTPGAWWNPAVDALAETLLDDEEHLAAAADLARCRGREGVTLEETLDDLAALFRAARLGEPPFSTVRTVSVHWLAAAQSRIEAAGCVDPRYGLGTAAHLDARLTELYREGHRHGFSPAETHSLIVVELPSVSETPWDDALRMSDVASCLRSVFDGGQAMGMASSRRAVVVSPRVVTMPLILESLRRMLRDTKAVTAAAEPAIWIESLPQEHAAAGRLLTSLTV
ncbi:MAG: hypothetical protein ACT4QF_18025 [Sporichthyaceae bacterium]